ncbi:MAG TPA: glycosyltransferase family 4 protein, partial [Candidatus Nanoarchaeia archaeon]|nr:glycosyltransferase family 4 protein [Candidatus Nanoarchaeia archaeon]
MGKTSVAVFNTQPPHLYFGGVERRIMETSSRLSGEIDFTVFSGTKEGFHKSVIVDGVKIAPCKSTDILFPLDNWTFNHTLKKTATQFRADIYESHNVSGYGLQKVLQKQYAKTQFITTVHGVLADEYARAQHGGRASARGKLANFFMKQLAKIEGESARNASLVVTISNYSSQKIVELYGVDKAKIRIVPNGVDPRKFLPNGNCVKTKERIGAGNKAIVLFVGRLIPRKGLLRLLEAARRIVGERSETLFVIVGDGPLRSQIVNEVNNSGLANNF